MSLPIVCTALVLLFPPSQDTTAKRARLSGRVETVDHVPWTGARVHLISYLYPNLAIGKPDIVEVESDRRGRFRAMVLPGRSYAAWATATVDANHYRTTPLESDLRAGMLVTLTEKEPIERKHIRISGLDAWKDSGPFECRAYTSWSAWPWLPIELDDHHEALLPEMPGSSCTVRVIDKNGRWLISKSTALERKKPSQSMSAKAATEATAKPKSEADDPTVIEIPKPYELLVRVRTDKKKPLPNAWVLLRQNGANVKLAETDEEGWAVARVPVGPKPGKDHVTLMVGAPGRVQVYANRYNMTFRSDTSAAEARKKGQPDVDIQLIDGTRVRGRLMLDAETPAAGVPILFHAPMPSDSGQRMFRGNSSSGDSYPATITTTDKDGRFAIEGYYPRFGHRLVALLDAGITARLPSSSEIPIVPSVILSSGVASDNPHDIGEVVLSELAILDVSVRENDGSRARQPKVTFMEPREKNGAHDPYQQEIVNGDRRGRLRILARPGCQLKIAAVSSRSYGIVDVTAPKSGQTLSQNLVLHTALRVSGRVRNQDGQPVPGLQIYYYAYSRAEQSRVLLALLRGTGVRTAADGSFSFTALPNTQYRVTIYGTIAGQRISQNNQLIQVGEEPITDLEFEVATPKLDPKKNKTKKGKKKKGEEPDKRR